MRKLYNKPRLVYGVGKNDADYAILKKITLQSGHKINLKCAFYVKWHHMLERCYDEKILNKYPTYRGCSVCDEWLSFSNFRAWMELQDWEGMDLDKDLIVDGNKIYSPETCVFIPAKLNAFLTNISKENLTGVTYSPKLKKFRSRCGNFMTGKREHLGYFDSADDAYLAWAKRKCDIAKEFSYQVSNERVKNALNNFHYRLPSFHSK